MVFHEIAQRRAFLTFFALYIRAVESNYAIAIATLSDWFKNLAPLYQPMRRITKTNRDLHARFSPRFEKVTWNCYEFGLVHCVQLAVFILETHNPSRRSCYPSSVKTGRTI